MPSEPVLWAKLSWPEIAGLVERGPKMAIWPLGTTEQHGWHLPIDVDIANCWEVARGVSANTGVPLLPPLAFGDSRHWKSWPGTLALRSETLIAIVADVCDGLYDAGIRKVLLLNGHVGNVAALQLAVGATRDRYPDLQIRALSWWDVSPRVVERMYWDAVRGATTSFHGNDGETSVYLAHSPERVDLARAIAEPDPAQRSYFFAYNAKRTTARGAVGNPLVATAEKGREILAMAIEDLTAEVKRAIAEDLPAETWTVGKGLVP